MTALPKLLAGIALAAVLSGCGQEQQPVRDASYFVANPEKIDDAMIGCRTGGTPSEVCQQAMIARQQIARAKRLEGYAQQLTTTDAQASAVR